MNLLDLFVKISVDDEASSKMDTIASGMIAKGEIIAEGIKSALSGVANALKSIWDNVIMGGVNAFATYEQLKGGIETFFGDSAQTVIDNAQEAYKTAGMSANKYMETISSFATSLVNSVAQRRNEVLENDVTAQKESLSRQLTQYQRYLEDVYNERSKAFSHEESQEQERLSDELERYREELSDKLSARRSELDDEYKQLQEELAEEVAAQELANDKAYKDRKLQLDYSYSYLEKSLQKEVAAYEKATNEKIAQINAEYSERLKLTDEEEYNRLKAIDDQIEALNGQTEAEQLAIHQREQQEKRAELIYKAANEFYLEDREKAKKQLRELDESIAQENRERERKDQIKSLKEQRDSIKQEYSERRAQIKSEQSQVVSQYKEGRAEELAETKESNKERLAEEKSHNEQILAELRAAQSQELNETRETNARVLSERREKHNKELAELSKSNSELTKERQRENARVLSDMRAAHQDELRELQRSNSDLLSAEKSYVANQKEELEQAANNTSEFIKATEEDKAEAARIAQVAMVDMSDNANKMGTSMEMIQNAYQGFAKDNFTMLDNLKLGFGGTKSEMERLLETAEQMLAEQGEYRDFSIDSFADIVEAIHVVQENYEISGYQQDELKQKLEERSLTEQELHRVSQDLYSARKGQYADEQDAYNQVVEAYNDGSLTVQDALILTGTTSNEASTTIEGAMNKAKAAWENWLIAITDPEQDPEQATKELMESVGNAAGLIVPRVKTIIKTLTDYVKEHGPEIFDEFKKAFKEAIPPEAQQDVENYKKALDGIAGAINSVVEAIKIVTLPLQALGEGLGYVAADIATTFDDTALNMAEIEAVNKNTADNMIKEWEGYPEEIRQKFINADGTLTEAGQSIIDSLMTGAGNEWEQKKPWWESIGDWIKEHKGPESKDATLLTSNGRAIIGGLMSGASVEWDASKSFFGNIMGTIGGFFSGASGLLDGSGQDIVGGLHSGAESSWDYSRQFFDSIPDFITSAFEGADYWLSGDGSGIVYGLLDGFFDVWDNGFNSIEDIPEQIMGVFSNCWEWLIGAGQSIMGGFFSGLQDAWAGIADWIGGIGQWIADNKGPESYDRALLVRNGRWIMSGLHGGLEEEFEGSVLPYVESMADAMEGAFGVPALSSQPVSSVASKQHGTTGEKKNLTVILQLDRTQFGRLVYELNSEETQRVGVNLTDLAYGGA